MDLVAQNPLRAVKEDLMWKVSRSCRRRLSRCRISRGNHGGDWNRVKEEVNGINRTDEHEDVATARVLVVLSDRSVGRGPATFLKFWSSNVVKVCTYVVRERRGVGLFQPVLANSQETQEDGEEGGDEEGEEQRTAGAKRRQHTAHHYN